MRSILDKLVNLFFKRNQIDSKFIRWYYFRYKGVKIGKYSYGCFTNAIPSGTIVGNYCSFGPGVKIFNANHGIKWASTHPFLYNTSLGMVEKEGFVRTKLTIGHDVWIGANVIILPSVMNVGNGAVIGAGSIVTKDVEPYSINVGNPSKKIKMRFDQEFIDELEVKKIYNYSKDQFFKNIPNMYKLGNFQKLEQND